jgi:c-di-GMP-binding flagellar brake protein YcgR
MDNQNPNNERRKFKRVKRECIVMHKIASSVKTRTSLANKEFNGIMLDLCEGGMAFLTHHKIPKFTLVRNKFILINDTTANLVDRLRPIEAKGKVRYNLCGERRMYRVGLRFTHISNEDRSFINKL